MSDEPRAPGSETSAPYTVTFSRQARRNLHENLPLDVAAAAMKAIDGTQPISRCFAESVRVVKT